MNHIVTKLATAGITMSCNLTGGIITMSCATAFKLVSWGDSRD